MSTPEDRFELLVAEMLEDVAPSRPPASLVPETERAVAATRRWPRWYASLRERPMRHHSTVAVGSPTARTAAILVATLLLVLATVAAGIAGTTLFAGPQSIVVDQTGAGDATTIAAAVAMAEDGDEILVREGTYTEAVVVDKDISIRGEGARDSIIWTAPDDGPTRTVDLVLEMPYTLLLDDTTVTLSDLTFSDQASAIHVDGGAPTIERVHLDGVGDPHTHATGYGQFDDAIVITGPSRAVVRDSILVASGPIVAYDGSEPLVEGNELVDGPSILAFTAGEGMVVRGNDVRSPMVRGIGVYGPSRITIEDNEISDAGGAAISVGAHGSAGTDPIVRRNTITVAQSGIEVAEAAAPTISANMVRGTRTGIKAGSGTDALVATANQLHDNEIGIAISTSDARFEGNTVLGGTAGIVLTGGGAPTIEGNTVEGSQSRGLAIGARTVPAVTDNRICSLGDPVVVDGEPSSAYDPDNDICKDAAGLIVVDESGAGDVATITEALALAQDGAEIHVRPGTYVEAVIIEKDISLSGDGPRDEIVFRAPEGGPTSLVDGSRSDPYAVLLLDTEATISGLTLSGVASAVHAMGGAPTLEGLQFVGVGEPTRGYGRGWFAAVVIDEGSDARVTGNTLEGGGPIVTFNGSRSTVVDNVLLDGPSITAYDPKDETVFRSNLVSGAADHGIGILGEGRILIENNVVRDVAGDGILIGRHTSLGTDPVVRGNDVSGSFVGISVAAAAAPTVSDNTIQGSRTGISTAQGSAALTVSDNTLVDNPIGIGIGGSSGVFDGNTVDGGATGVVIVSGGAAVLRSNSIAGASSRGVVIEQGSDPTLIDNEICGSTENLDVPDGDDEAFHATNDICEDTASE